MRVDCSFRLDFEEADSVALAFGGDPELSVEHLTFGANPRLEARYDAAAKRLLCAEAERKRAGKDELQLHKPVGLLHLRGR